MCDDILSVNELLEKKDRMKLIRVSYADTYLNFTEEEIQVNLQFKELLIRGIQVSHHFNGEIITSILTFDERITSIVILPIEDAVKEEPTNYFYQLLNIFTNYFIAPITVKQSSVKVIIIINFIYLLYLLILLYYYLLLIKQTLSLNDISDVRVGSHAYDFVLTNSTDKHELVMSIIGSQCTISIELSSAIVKNIFAERFGKFIYFAILENRHFM